MPFIAVDVEEAAEVDLYYEDLGSGRPVVLIHGYPLGAQSWARQIPPLLATGYRVIRYDRRGFGRSDRPTVGYDYNTFAADLNTLVEVLDLTDAALVGFGMGTGEIGRYLSSYGPDRVSRVVFIAGLQPSLLKTNENPAGVDSAAFVAALSAVARNRGTFLADFCSRVNGFSGRSRNPKAAECVAHYANSISAYAAVAALVTWSTDFRRDVAKIAGFDTAAMILHGTRDQVAPIDATARQLRKLLPDARYVELAGAPHGLLWMESEFVNDALLSFLSDTTSHGHAR
jgi:non-heme chloroperoxidase